jgi:hypothetical protein
MKARTLMGVLLIWVFCSDLQAQVPAPWPEPEVCNDALLEDYQRREELIFDLMMYMEECRLRYGGCAPDSTWTLDDAERRWRTAHPDAARDEVEERAHWRALGTPEETQ